MTENESLPDDSWGMGGVPMSQQDFEITGIMPVLGSKPKKEDFAGWIRFGKDTEKETDPKKRAEGQIKAEITKREFREKIFALYHLLEKGKDVIVTPRAGGIVVTVVLGSVIAVELAGYRGKHLKQIIEYFRKEDETKGLGISDINMLK